MKATVAANDTSPRDVLGVLMADVDEAAWCVFAVLEQTELLQEFVLRTPLVRTMRSRVVAWKSFF